MAEHTSFNDIDAKPSARCNPTYCKRVQLCMCCKYNFEDVCKDRAKHYCMSKSTMALEKEKKPHSIDYGCETSVMSENIARKVELNHSDASRLQV